MIISYLKVLNGGFGSIAEAGLWAQEKVCADTALTDRSEIRQYLHAYGFPKNQFKNHSRAVCSGYDPAMRENTGFIRIVPPARYDFYHFVDDGFGASPLHRRRFGACLEVFPGKIVALAVHRHLVAGGPLAGSIEL